MTLRTCTTLLALAFPALLAAQAPATPPPADSLYQRAARLVREGQGAAGRTLVDSIITTLTEGEPAYGEALYWRAALATSAAAAERDYKRVIVEYPASPRAEDALVTLAQLELARGDRQRALSHLDRLRLEHPGSAQLARASLWAARAWFDLRDTGRACDALGEARAALRGEDVETGNQIRFLESRCVGVAVAPAATASPAARDTRPETRDAVDAGKTRFSVQVAAYNTSREAESLVKRLNARGYTARVVGAARPFRVRVGSYATRAEANAALGRMKKAGLSGFVAEGGEP